MFVSALIGLFVAIWFYATAQGIEFLITAILLISGIYGIGVIRLWRNAGWGCGIPVWRAACFLMGILLVAFTLTGPLDELADQAFSMHMLQHVLLLKVAAPLLLLGEFTPVFLWAIGRTNAHRASLGWTRSWVGRFWNWLITPWCAWTLYGLCLWVWHVPAFYQAALKSESLHSFEHFLFLGTALLFWGYLLQPGRQRLIRYGTAVLYLFTTLLHESILGALLTFSSQTWYPFYSASSFMGLTPLGDQQLAGVIMWLPGGILFTLLMVVYFGLWLRMIEKGMPGTQTTFVRTGDGNG